MKKAGIVVALVALAYLAVSFGLGFLVQSRMTINADELRARAPYLTIKSQTFEHGLFHSSQTTVIAFSPALMLPPGAPKVGNLGFEVTLRNRIAHGPVCGLKCVGLANIDTSVELPASVANMLNAIYGTQSWLTLRTRLGFLGGSTTNMSSPPVADAATAAGHFSSEGFSAVAHVSSGANQIDIDGSLPHLLFSGVDGGRVDLQALTFKSVSHRVLPQLFATDFNFALERMDVEGKPGTMAGIQKLSYSGATAVSGDFADMTFRFDTGAASASSVNFKALHVDLTLKHLKLEALQAINELSQDFNSKLQGTSMEERQQRLAKMKEPMLALLAAGAELRLDHIGFETDKGTAQVTGGLHFNGLTEADIGGDNPWRGLLAKADMDLAVVLDDAAIAALPGPANTEQLQKLADQGLFTHESGKWSSNLHMAGGKLTANGKPFVPTAAQAH